MGCKPNCDEMKELIGNLEISVSNDNTSDKDFTGLTDRYLYKLVNENKISLICGKALGCKDKKNNKIVIDDLLIDSEINYCKCNLFGIYLPKEEILKRHKFQWFTRLNHRQILESNTQAGKHLLITLGKYNK